MSTKTRDKKTGAKSANGKALRTAEEAFLAGRFEDAERQARALITADPRAEAAWCVFALAVQRQGRVRDTGEILQDAIANNPRSADLYALMATMLRDSGRKADAETAARYALELEPGQRDAALLLGNFLAEQGRLNEAKAEFAAGAKRAPKDPAFPLQLGRVALLLGQVDDAHGAFENAAALSRKVLDDGGHPVHTDIYLNAIMHLATLLHQRGDRVRALNYLDEAIRLRDSLEARMLFAVCVRGVTFVKAFPPLRPLMMRALTEAWIDPAELARPTVQQILLDEDFAAAVKSVVDADDNAVLEEAAVQRITTDPLLLALLGVAIIPDPVLEKVLTRLRRNFLAAVSAGTDVGPHVFFMAALANQCFFTEYAYATSDAENKQIANLEAAVAKQNAPALAVLAAYRALHTLDNARTLAAQQWPAELRPVIEHQLIEPAREADLRQTIPAITPITDATSVAVRAQYEENPFPRWVRARDRHQPKSLAAWVQGHFPHLPAPQAAYRDPATQVDILVAGCGTGQETAATATRFQRSDVVAVDLSLTSLAYAARQMENLGLKNVTFAQADILALEGIGRQFDVVECGGVLHHLADPVAGWRVLAGLTKPGGYMLMALYSDLGRRDLEPAIAFARDGGYGTSAEELRRFRTDVLALPANHAARSIAVDRNDFYNLSMLRDLVFHVEEHRFTIADIRAAQEQLGLEFGGFGVEPEIMAKFRQAFGAQADVRSLALWEEFERNHPAIFSAMYHFLVLRPAR